MRARNISIGVIMLAIAVTGLLVFMIIRSYDLKKKQELNRASIPSLNLLLSDSSMSNTAALTGAGPTLIILFNSECEHCSDEARDIRDHVDTLSGITTVFISSEELGDINDFGLRHELNGRDHIYLAKADPSDLSNVFGTISFPRILLYGADQALLHDFKGTTRVEAILKHLPQ